MASRPSASILCGDLVRDHFVFMHDHLIGDRVADIVPGRTADDQLRQRNIDLIAAADAGLRDTLQRAAVALDDDHVLRHIDQLTGQVTGVGRLEGRIRQTFAGAVRRAEVFQHRQAFAEVRLNGRLDNLAAGLGHQGTHTGKLLNLVDAAAGPGIRHQVDRVQIRRAVVVRVLFQAAHHFVGHGHTGMGPCVDDLVVPLAFGQDAVVVVLLDLADALFRFRDDLRLLQRDLQVGQAEAQARERRILEAQILDPVEQIDRLGACRQYTKQSLMTWLSFFCAIVML